jgi:hypothetical protein
MNAIQIMMESNAHLDGDLDKLEKLLSRTSIYWAHMDDVDIDYIHAARYAIEQKIRWKINK